MEKSSFKKAVKSHLLNNVREEELSLYVLVNQINLCVLLIYVICLVNCVTPFGCSLLVLIWSGYSSLYYMVLFVCVYLVLFLCTILYLRLQSSHFEDHNGNKSF